MGFVEKNLMLGWWRRDSCLLYSILLGPSFYQERPQSHGTGRDREPSRLTNDGV